MSDKKHHKHTEEEVSEAQAGAVEAPEAQDAELDALQKRAEEAEARARELETKSAENLDGWQRAVAEFQNYRKRVERDRVSDQEAMKSDLILKILPVLDDLERALQHRLEDDVWANGIELIRRKLQAVLEAEGVQRIKADGAIFDPNFHEAISQEPVDGAESGRVVEVLLQGYVLGDHVIRPAQVRIAA